MVERAPGKDGLRRWQLSAEAPPGPDGRRRRISTVYRGSSKKAAAQALLEHITSVRAAHPVPVAPSSRMPFAEWSARWLDHLHPAIHDRFLTRLHRPPFPRQTRRTRTTPLQVHELVRQHRRALNLTQPTVDHHHRPPLTQRPARTTHTPRQIHQPHRHPRKGRQPHPRTPPPRRRLIMPGGI